jgi:hypothetical protein
MHHFSTADNRVHRACGDAFGAADTFGLEYPDDPVPVEGIEVC